MEKTSPPVVESNCRLCIDVRSQSRKLTNPRDVEVDEGTFFVLLEHVEEGFYIRGIKYHGVVRRVRKFGYKGPNCIDPRYTNIFITGHDSFFHVYVIRPST